MKSQAIFRRFSRAQKLLLTAPALAGAAVPAAQAEIIHTNISGGISANNVQGIYFNLETGAYSPAPAPAMDFVLYFTSNDAGKPSIGTIDGMGVAGSSDLAYKLAFGAPINNTLSFSASVQHLYFTFIGSWPPPSSGYLGLQSVGGNYGWANVTYTGTLMTLYGFAYENSGAPITAGAVPEPATTALLGALVAGSVVAFAARRKRLAAKRAA